MRGDHPPVYGLDIETDTSADGLDPSVSPIVAVAVAAASGDTVLTGPEVGILRRLDQHLAGLAPGVLVTWHGSVFDLPFLADRARLTSTRIGLHLDADERVPPPHRPLPGHHTAYRGSWYGHTHLDAHRLYRHVRLALGASAALKSIARYVGLACTEVDCSRIHELSRAELERYVASDARLARLLALRQWARAPIALDGPVLPRPTARVVAPLA